MISPAPHPNHPNAVWIKSDASGQASDCIDVALLRSTMGMGMGIRDSKRPAGGVLVFSFAGFTALVGALRVHEST